MQHRVLALAGAALLAAGSVRAQQPRLADLAGTWVLERDLSQFPERPGGRGPGMRGGPGGEGGPGMEPGGRPGGGPPMGGGFGGRGRGGFGGRGRGEGGPGGPGGEGGPPPGMRVLFESARPAERLVITSDDSTLSVAGGEGPLETWHPDGRAEKDVVEDVDVETRARWKDGRLDVERKVGNAGSVRRVYSRDAKSGYLIVEMKVAGGRMPGSREFRLVYSPASSKGT